jgi:hypothetical protein
MRLVPRASWQNDLSSVVRAATAGDAGGPGWMDWRSGAGRRIPCGVSGRGWVSVRDDGRLYGHRSNDSSRSRFPILDAGTVRGARRLLGSVLRATRGPPDRALVRAGCYDRTT